MFLPEKQTLTELFLEASRRYEKKICFQVYRDGGVYNRLSYGEFGRRVKAFASVLMGLGLEPGGRVMILAENRPEWPIAYFATALAGGISVPVLTDFTAEQIGEIASHSGISVLCYTQRTAPKTLKLPPRLPAILLDREEPHPEAGPILTDGKLPAVNGEDTASIIYTSGVTGKSKGVLLSHKNLVYTAAASRSLTRIFSRDRLLSVLPLAHAYECSLGMLTAVMSGASVTYLDKPPSPAVLLPAMRALRPTAMITVPLFIEKICRRGIFPVMKRNPLYRFPLTRRIAVLLAGRKLLSALGSSIRFFGIGGAPLAEDVERFLREAGFPYSIGYGLTETAPLIAGSAPYKFPRGSCGRTLGGMKLRIDKADEIQVKGSNVMSGYYRDEGRTREAFTDDGWFKTGDLGRLDKKGNLFIHGRSKSLILGPSGENIYPEEIESMLHAFPLVEDALVVPGERGELVALIVPDEKTGTEPAALGVILEEMKNRVNKKLRTFSHLARIEIRNEPFEKTPTKKIKRYLYTN